MPKNKKIVFGLIAASAILISIIGSYAFFTGVINTNNKLGANLNTGTMSLSFEDGDNGISEQLEFGQSVTKKFRIVNTGSLQASLSLDWKNLVNTYLNGSLSYNLSYSDTLDGEYTPIITETNMPVSSNPINQAIASELSVPAGDTYYYNLEITLNYTDFDQESDLNAHFNTEFTVSEPSRYRYYTLTVNPNGGTWETFTAPQEYLLKNKETKTITGIPTRTGYTFAGWKIIGNSSTLTDGVFKMGISDTYLVAAWTPVKVKVTIDGVESEVDYGSTIELGPVPEKDGYTSGSWTTTGGLLENNTLKVTTTEDIVVTSTYEFNGYKYIVYHNKMNLDGATYTRVEADTYEGTAGSNTSVTPEVKTYTGFTSPEAKSLTIQEETTYPPVLNKVEYNYTRNKYNLTKTIDGTTTTEQIFYETTVDLGTPEKTGYNFTNWTQDGTVLTDNTLTILNDVAITANYTPKEFEVTFNPNAGTIETASKIVAYDSTYGEMPIPTYDGYVFKGWFTEKDGGTQITDSTKVELTGNQTLYAHWKANILQIVTADYAEELWSQKSNIKKIVFENTMNAPQTYADSYDISNDSDSSVMAYLVTDTTDSSKYIAHIQSNGKIFANSDSSYLFHRFNNLESIEGLEYLDTSNATNMHRMFARCGKLTTLDVTKLNTDNVIDMSYMFYNCNNLTALDVTKFNTGNVTDMSYMFSECNSLTTLDVTKLNTEKVTNMHRMFNGCNSLTALDITQFNTSNVTDMGSMFYNCSSLTTLDVTKLNTSNVTDMSNMFFDCSGLTTLDVTQFNTSNVDDMGSMFKNCSSLTILDVTQFNTSNVSNMTNMFFGCSGLITLDVTQFNTGNVTDMSYMFYNCSGLTSLDVTKFNTNNVVDMHRMFADCSNLTTLDVTQFNTSNVTDMHRMFNNCSSLTSLDVTKFNTSNVDDMNCMFYNCSSLTALDVTNFNTGNVVDMSYMFAECNSLTALDVTQFNTGKVVDMHKMFHNCSSLTSLSVTNFVTDNVIDMNCMFYNCSGLTTLDVTKFVTNNVTNMAYMFFNCNDLTTLDVTNFVTDNVTDMSYMFSDCSSLTSLDVTQFNTSNVTSMHRMFAGCSSLTTLDVSNFNTSNVVDMGSMFNRCLHLTSLDLSNFNTSNVTDMGYMFASCNDLNTIGDIGSWNTDKVDDMDSMFYACVSLTSLNLSNFNTSSVTTTLNMFYDCNSLTTTITIRGTKCTEYEGMFTLAATSGQITVNYTSDASSLVDNMIATKSDTSNVVKGTLVS